MLKQIWFAVDEAFCVVGWMLGLGLFGIAELLNRAARWLTGGD